MQLLVLDGVAAHSRFAVRGVGGYKLHFNAWVHEPTVPKACAQQIITFVILTILIPQTSITVVDYYVYYKLRH